MNFYIRLSNGVTQILVISQSCISHTKHKHANSLHMFQIFVLYFLTSASRVEFHHSHGPRIRVQFLEIRAISSVDVFWLVFLMEITFYV